MIDIFVTQDRNFPIKREIGFVSTTDASERAEAITKLKEEAARLGGNALILLRAEKAGADPHFSRNEFHAHGVAVEV